MYRENREGAKIEPCGTPQVRGAGEEKTFPSFTKKFCQIGMTETISERFLLDLPKTLI